MMKMQNGNGKFSKNITVIHWNIGAKGWEKKKLEMETVIMQFSPDIFAISEAYMRTDLSEQQKQVTGYKMILPRTVELHNHARLVVLIKEEMEVEILHDLMDNQVAAVWIKVGGGGRKAMKIGLVYREHQYIWQQQENDSGSMKNQRLRWNMFVDKWRRAAKGSNVMVTQTWTS